MFIRLHLHGMPHVAGVHIQFGDLYGKDGKVLTGARLTEAPGGTLVSQVERSNNTSPGDVTIR